MKKDGDYDSGFARAKRFQTRVLAFFSQFWHDVTTNDIKAEEWDLRRSQLFVMVGAALLLWSGILFLAQRPTGLALVWSGIFGGVSLLSFVIHLIKAAWRQN